MNVTSRGNCNICKRISVWKLLVVATNCYRPMLYVNCLNCKCNSHSTQICLWYNHSFLISQSRYSICQSIEFAWQINACTWWKLRAISGTRVVFNSIRIFVWYYLHLLECVTNETYSIVFMFSCTHCGGTTRCQLWKRHIPYRRVWLAKYEMNFILNWNSKLVTSSVSWPWPWLQNMYQGYFKPNNNISSTTKYQNG